MNVYINLIKSYLFIYRMSNNKAKFLLRLSVPKHWSGLTTI